MNYDSIDILSDEQVLSTYDDTVGYTDNIAYVAGFWIVECKNGRTHYTRGVYPGICGSCDAETGTNFGCGWQPEGGGAVSAVCGANQYGCHYCVPCSTGYTGYSMYHD